MRRKDEVGFVLALTLHAGLNGQKIRLQGLDVMNQVSCFVDHGCVSCIAGRSEVFAAGPKHLLDLQANRYAGCL